MAPVLFRVAGKTKPKRKPTLVCAISVRRMMSNRKFVKRVKEVMNAEKNTPLIFSGVGD